CRIVLVPATRTRNKLADLGAVAAGLAHEIRNPLNSLYINGQLLEEMLSELPEERVPQKGDLLSLARANLKVTQRLNDTLSGFLRFARPPAMELALVDLNRILSETLRFLETELAYRGVTLKTKLHPMPLPILADEKLLKQALLNLLLNAQEAVEKEEKVIRVTTGVSAGRPFVRIHDNGRGIAPSDRRRIFRLFFTTRKNGSGLGLPIVRQIVRQHGGAVYVRSREGKGTTMTVSLLFEEQFRAMFPGRLPLALPPGGRP
ncbi:MAG: ATP-binding protein, partial [Candidatus Deferrimicrobium sp.]